MVYIMLMRVDGNAWAALHEHGNAWATLLNNMFSCMVFHMTHFILHMNVCKKQPNSILSPQYNSTYTPYLIIIVLERPGPHTPFYIGNWCMPLEIRTVKYAGAGSSSSRKSIQLSPVRNRPQVYAYKQSFSIYKCDCDVPIY